MIGHRDIGVIKFIFAVILTTTAIFNVRAEKKIIDELPTISETIKDFNIQNIKAEIKELDLHHIEGIWQFTATGTEVAICRLKNSKYGQLQQITSYNIILISAPNRALRPGTIIGIISATPQQGEYDARLYTQALGSTLTVPKRFTLTLDDNDNALTFRQHRSAFSFKPWRLLPYFWRGVIQQNKELKSAAGCVRTYPIPTLPREPIYL